MEYIGILTALNLEFNAVLKGLGASVSISAVNNVKYKIAECNAGTKSILLLKTGYGITNATEATRYLLQQYQIGKIINIGLAGAVSSNITIGDVIIADLAISEHETACYPDAVLNHELCNGLTASSVAFTKARVITTQKAVLSARRKHEINDRYQADAVDMEAHAILKACATASIPYAAVKVISDHCSLSCFQLLAVLRNINTAIKKLSQVTKAILDYYRSF